MKHTEHPLKQYLADCPNCRAMSAKKKLWYELCDLIHVAPDTPMPDVQDKIARIYQLAFKPART